MKKAIVSLLVICFLAPSFTTQAQNSRNIVIEYTTSTQCGGCPCLDSVLQQVVLVRHPQTIVLACHTAWSHFGNYHGQAVSDSLNSAGGDPSACIDRTVYNVEGFNAFVDSVDARYAAAFESPVKLEIAAKSYNRATRVLTIEVDAESVSDTLNGIYRISFVIVEGNIMFQQSAHPPCTGGPSYIHFDVVRNMVNDVYGDTVINGDWPRGFTYHKTFSTVIDDAWVADNSDFIVYIFKQKPGPLRKIFDYRIQQGVRFPVAHGVGTEEINGVFSSIMNIFPNPASSITNIHFSIRQETTAVLKIFSLEGKEVRSLVNAVFQKGEYNFELNTEGLQKGIYQCIMKTDDGIDVKKLVIL